MLTLNSADAPIMRSLSATELQSLNTLELRPNCPEANLISDPQELTRFLRSLSARQRQSLHVAGELSNTVLGDLSTLLLLFRDGTGLDIARSENSVLVHVDGSVKFDALVEMLCNEGIPGLELLSGIPGTVGAAVVQNIAAYGQKLSDRFLFAHAIDVDSCSIVKLDRDAMRFSYRSSSLKDPTRYTPNFIVLDAVFQLPTHFDPIKYEDIRRIHTESGRAVDDSLARRTTVLEARRRKGMVVGSDNWLPSAGSFFVSPVVPTAAALEIAELVRGSRFAENFLSWYQPDARHTRCPAALVMRAAGFVNGDRWGPVGLSPHHILAICRYSPATASDVATVASLVQSRVRDNLGILLETEVRYAGSIDVREVKSFLARYSFVPGQGEPDWVLGISGP